MQIIITWKIRFKINSYIRLNVRIIAIKSSGDGNVWLFFSF